MSVRNNWVAFPLTHKMIEGILTLSKRIIYFLLGGGEHVM